MGAGSGGGGGAGGDDAGDDLDTGMSGHDLDLDLDLDMAGPSPPAPAGPSHRATNSKGDIDIHATPSTADSTPDADIEPDPTAEPSSGLAQPARRKGGRKPIYATSEERKQRNRQAQAAFRERRTEYIKQLEATIKQHEDTLSALQQSHRSAADECLILRYKNSLLERILLEKGVDVQAELNMKAGSATGLQHPAANIPHIPQPPLQRTAVQRQHARRSGQNFLPRTSSIQTHQEASSQSSMQGHPTPSSHASSPNSRSNRSPMMVYQGGAASPTSAGLPQAASQFPFPAAAMQGPAGPAFFAQQQLQQMPPHAQVQLQQRFQNQAAMAAGMGMANINMNMNINPSPTALASAHYPSPFQKHIDQLELEYDAQETQAMLDQPDGAEDAMSATSPDGMQAPFTMAFDQQHAQAVQRAPQLRNPQRQAEYFHAANSVAMSPSHSLGGPITPQQLQAQMRRQGSSAGQQSAYEAQPKLEQRNSSSHSGSVAGQGSNAGSASGGNYVHHPNIAHQQQMPNAAAAFNAMDIDPNDPMLSEDPFGLSASMHYPTSYSFETAAPSLPQQPRQQQRR